MNNTAIQTASTAGIEPKKPKSIQDLIQESVAQLGNALPEHMKPERMVRLALTTLRTNPDLYKCDSNSVLAAIFQCAALGLEPNIQGEAWIIPYNNRVKVGNEWKSVKVAQFQIGAYGFVKLFWHHKNAVALQVEAVKENDVFEYDLGQSTISHKHPAFGKTRGKSVGYYASAQLANNGRVVKVMSKEEAEDFAKKFSKCYDKEKGSFYKGTPWADHFDEMAKKTVLKQLMKLLPKSVEIQNALRMDETVKSKIAVDMLEVADENDHQYAEEVKETNGHALPASKEDDGEGIGEAETKELLTALKAAKTAKDLTDLKAKADTYQSEGRITEAQFNAVTEAIGKRQA